MREGNAISSLELSAGDTIATLREGEDGEREEWQMEGGGDGSRYRKGTVRKLIKERGL